MKKYKDFLKPIVLTLITNALLYFLIKLLPTTPHLITSRFNFPLIKEFVYIYNSWYPFLILISFVIYKNDKNTWKKLIYSLLIGIILINITYILYPTIIERPLINVNNFTDLILDITYKLDTPALNCVPSAHCLFCFIYCYFTCITKNLKPYYKIIIILYFMLIILSTLLINQHLLIDVITAFIYTLISMLITTNLYTKIDKKVSKIFS